jgi:hypothetical protein
MYTTLQSGKYQLILVESETRSTMENANFANTGKALKGVLLPNETIEEWEVRQKKRQTLEYKVIEWGRERNFFCPKDGVTFESQLAKLEEEKKELDAEIEKENPAGILLEAGDCYVVITFLEFLAKTMFEVDIVERERRELNKLMKMLYIEPRRALEAAYKKIEHRKGKMVKRTFVKECTCKIPTISTEIKTHYHCLTCNGIVL